MGCEVTSLKFIRPENLASGSVPLDTGLRLTGKSFN